MAGPVKKPSVSVIIAVYEHADFLEKVFTSLQNQTFTDFEIVIADDGSGDEIASCINRFQNSFSYPIQRIWHPNKGFRKTIIVNRAVLDSTSDYLVFIDGDCILHARFLEYHVKRRKRGTVLTGRRVMLNESLSSRVTLDDIRGKKIQNIRFWWGQCNRAGVKHGLFIPGFYHLKNLFKRKSSDILGSNFSVFKDDFLSINGYDERIIGRGMEDNNLSARFNRAGFRFKTVSHEALQYHLYHNSDPIPHSKEAFETFCKNVDSAFTDFGAVKVKH